jgi:hypothetical protein
MRSARKTASTVMSTLPLTISLRIAFARGCSVEPCGVDEVVVEAVVDSGALMPRPRPDARRPS